MTAAVDTCTCARRHDGPCQSSRIELVPTDVERGMRAIHAIERAINHESRQLERVHGISLAQLVALQQLARGPVTSLNEMAKRTGTHQSSVSVVMKRLFAKGLVLRRVVAIDRRRRVYELTEAGRRELEKSAPTVYARLEFAMGMPLPYVQATFADLFENIIAFAGIPL